MKKVLLYFLVVLMFAGCGKDPGMQPESGMNEQQMEQTAESTFDLLISKDYVAETQTYQYDVTRNDDGSVTYHITQTQYDQLLCDLGNELDAVLQGMMKDIPSFTAIDHDEAFQVLTVETTSSELSFVEAASMIKLFACGLQYNAYAGNVDAVIHISYMHEGTEVFSCDSSQLG